MPRCANGKRPTVNRRRRLLNLYNKPLLSIPKFYLVIATSTAEQSSAMLGVFAAMGMNFA
jgi:hypothetical protein